MDVEADADAGSEGRVRKEVSRGDTPRLEMSNGRGRKQEMWTKTVLAHSLALSSPMRPPACMQIETRGSLARSPERGGKKSFKTGKRMSTTLARSASATNLAPLEGGREDISCYCNRRRRRRCCLLFLPFLRKGNGGAKRSFITQATATATARPTGFFSSHFLHWPRDAVVVSGRLAR